jgi:hypothetical protein
MCRLVFAGLIVTGRRPKPDARATFVSADTTVYELFWSNRHVSVDSARTTTVRRLPNYLI